MKPLWHGIAGAALGLAAYKVTGSLAFASVSAAAEILIDTDHIIDHLTQSDKPYDIKAFFSTEESLKWRKIMFVFHSYELILLMAVAAFYFSYPLLWAAAIGMLLHMILDEIGNRNIPFPIRMVPAFYFFSCRLINGFNANKLIHRLQEQEINIRG
ncbi:hypothetical protein [Candidatus Magnetomonas plexicatena]|uniref:hypothetical protein n=1 Tax=Candidatus Magnetomonas plexicatena TaxID=2552947 RepID=UPI00110401F8|nr:hypothetical protein E2O03_014375 [Nitrospirales bacterium LBB_01]